MDRIERPMSIESSVNSTQPDSVVAVGPLNSARDPAWGPTFAAAMRVIEHHRSTLDARMTIQRLSHEEPRSEAGANDAPSGRV